MTDFVTPAKAATLAAATAATVVATDPSATAVTYVGGTALVGTLVVWFIKKALGDLNAAATDHANNSAGRAQVDSLREELQRLESLVKWQSTRVEKLNNEIMKLRLAFIDEQSALLRLLAEFSASNDPATRKRIAIEVEAARKRRNNVANITDAEA